MVDWTQVVLRLVSESVPLAQKMIESYAIGNADERRMKLATSRINQMEKVLSKVKPSTSGQKLSKGVLQNESIQMLGRRKWKEYKTFLESLPENAPASEVQTALKKIDSNIRKDYPCTDCKENSIVNLKKSPLITSKSQTKKQAQIRLCNFHNVTREFLGKPITHNCEVIFD